MSAASEMRDAAQARLKSDAINRKLKEYAELQKEYRGIQMRYATVCGCLIGLLLAVCTWGGAYLYKAVHTNKCTETFKECTIKFN